MQNIWFCTTRLEATNMQNIWFCTTRLEASAQPLEVWTVNTELQMCNYNAQGL